MYSNLPEKAVLPIPCKLPRKTAKNREKRSAGFPAVRFCPKQTERVKKITNLNIA